MTAASQVVRLVAAVFVVGCFANIVAVPGVLAGNVTYDGRSIIINGKRELIFSGSIHYPRSQPAVSFVTCGSFFVLHFFGKIRLLLCRSHDNFLKRIYIFYVQNNGSIIEIIQNCILEYDHAWKQLLIVSFNMGNNTLKYKNIEMILDDYLINYVEIF